MKICQFCYEYPITSICEEHIGDIWIGSTNQILFCTRCKGHTGPHIHCSGFDRNHVLMFKVTGDSYLTFPLTKGLYENR